MNSASVETISHRTARTISMGTAFNDLGLMRELLDRLGDKWSALTISMVRSGPLRFGQLRQALGGVSQKVLSDLVRSLERDGFLSRRVVVRTPLHVEYRLTALGVALVGLIDEIERWARTHEAEVVAHRRAYDESQGENS